MSDPNGKLKLDPTLAVQAVSWVVAVLLAYGMIRADVAVLQTKYDRVMQDITEIKIDIRELLNYERSHQH